MPDDWHSFCYSVSQFYSVWCFFQPATVTVTHSSVTMIPRWIRGEQVWTSMDTTEGEESVSIARWPGHSNHNMSSVSCCLFWTLETFKTTQKLDQKYRTYVRLYLCHQPSGYYCWRNYICAFCMFFPKHEKLCVCVCVSFILLASHNGGKLWALRAYLLQVTWLHHRISTGLLT